MTWEGVATVFGVVGSVLGILGVLFGWWGWLWRKIKIIRVRSHKGRIRVPIETIRIVPHIRKPWWGLGAMNGRSAMQVGADLYVTNITDRNVFVLATYIEKPLTEGHVLTRHPEDTIYSFSKFPILPKQTSEVSVDYWVQPPFTESDFETTLVLIDQFGNKHRVKKVLFKKRGSKG